MDLHTLREFVAIVDFGNLEHASFELFTTQSSLSKHIKKLESELQVSLFEKHGRRNQLTEAGKSFLPYARHMLDLEDEADSVLQKYRTDYDDKVVSISSVAQLGAYHISDILTRFHQNYPQIQVQMTISSETPVHQLLTDQTVDLAFMRSSPWDDMSQFVVLPFMEDELCFICPSDNPLSKYDFVNLEMLKDENFIGYRSNSFISNFTARCCGEAGFTPNIVVVSQGIENIVDLVTKNIGVALHMLRPVLYYAKDNSKVKIMRIIPEYKCRIDLCYSKSKKLTDSDLKFIEEVKTWCLQNPEYVSSVIPEAQI